MNIKGVGIGRGVAVGPVIRMAAPLPEPSDAPRAENISAEPKSPASKSRSPSSTPT